MPRYFFNHRTSNGQRDLDIDGLKLDSLNSALEEATFAAQGAIALAEEPLRGEFEIEDEGRVVVARVPYAAVPSETDGAEDEGPEQPPASAT